MGHVFMEQVIFITSILFCNFLYHLNDHRASTRQKEHKKVAIYLYGHMNHIMMPKP